MKRNQDYVGSDIYGPHLHGDRARFSNSGANTEVAVLQRMYMRLLTELAANRFHWEGLPKEIDVRFMELTLFWRALVLFFKDDNSEKFLVTRGTSQGNWDVTDNPRMFLASGANFRERTLRAYNVYDDEGNIESDPEVVPIWANYLRVPDLDIVMIYASKFAELDRTIEINSKNARRTKVIAAKTGRRLSVNNITRQIDQGEGVIEITDDAVDDLPTALDLGIDMAGLEKLHILKVRLWNECMGYLGINNANQDKKERLVAEEVGANNEQVSATRAISLNERKVAAEKINELYNLNVTVCYNSDIDAQAVMPGTETKPENKVKEGQP